MVDRVSRETKQSRSAGWVDQVLLAGDGAEACLWLGKPVDRGTLRELVDDQQRQLTAAGLAEGGTVSLRLPPSLGYVAALLAAWRIGAQVSLLDHRLTQYEVDRALGRLTPQVLVQAAAGATAAPQAPMSAMRGYAVVETVATPRRDGTPAATGHALVQLSSGSTGPSKVIARTAADLETELGRYDQLDGYPRRGERIVCLASIVHVLGLVGGLLHGLHAGVELVFADRLTSDGILKAVAAAEQPTMILGVPFHAELLASAAAPPVLPQFVRMVVAGELLRPHVPAAFAERYAVPLGTMYGMTELGVIATDLHGRTWPAVTAAPGMNLRVVDGELQVQMAASPYIGLVDPTRWSDGWLHTRDAAREGPGSGQVTILGRLDSQVSIGGLKVDLMEVEQTLAALPEVAEVVVLYDDAINAYLALREGASLGGVEEAVKTQLAAFKRPRHMHVVPRLPRTASGKIVRDRAALRTLADRESVTR
jgi:3-hydroxy-4-methylanthranilate adenylyltransferase